MREDRVIGPLNKWIAHVYDRDHIDKTVAAIVAELGASSTTNGQYERAQDRLADAAIRLRRHQAAIDAGVNPAALVDVINTAERERAAAKAERDNLPPTAGVTAAEIYARIGSLPNVRAAVSKHAPPEKLSKLYDAIGLELRYVQMIRLCRCPRRCV